MHKILLEPNTTNRKCSEPRLLSVHSATDNWSSHQKEHLSALSETRKTRNYAENRFTSFTACGGTGFGETAAAKWNAAVSTIQPAWLKTLFLPRKRAKKTTTLKSFEHHRH